MDLLPGITIAEKLKGTFRQCAASQPLEEVRSDFFVKKATKKPFMDAFWNDLRNKSFGEYVLIVSLGIFLGLLVGFIISSLSR